VIYLIFVISMINGQKIKLIILILDKNHINHINHKNHSSDILRAAGTREFNIDYNID